MAPQQPSGEDMSIIVAEHPDPKQSLTYGNHADHVIDVFGANSSNGVVIYIHGGYWRPQVDRKHARTTLKALSERGLQCFSLEYRRVPGQPSHMITDCINAIATLAPLIGNRPTSIVGHSAGGWLALHVAPSLPPSLNITRVVLLAPVTDLANTRTLELGDGAVAEMFPDPDHDQTTYAVPSTITPPLVVIHGTHDTRVLHHMSADYATKSSSRLITYPGVGHFSLIDPQHETWATTAAVIDPRNRPQEP